MVSKKRNNNYIIGLATGLLITFFIFKVLPTLQVKLSSNRISIPFLTKIPTVTPDPTKLQQEITKEVLPQKVNLGISFEDSVVRMVKFGAIDKEKLLSLYEDRGGLKDEEKKLLDATSDKEIILTPDNAGLLLNLLWPLGIANKTNVLSEGPMGTQYKDTVGNFASTGGWTLGKEDGGSLYNRFEILKLTPQEENLVTEISQNIYRPCCGNSTYFPDCNHGAAMLGFIELAVTQGMPKEQIYQKALALNSLWFPQTYAELGVYFRMKKGTPWTQVDPQEVLGQNYSSGSGYIAISKQLQAEGLLPKVEGGGGCGV